MAAGLLLIIAGIWLLTQTLVGGLPDRISSYAGIGPKGDDGPKVTGGSGTAEDPYTTDPKDSLPGWVPDADDAFKWLPGVPRNIPGTDFGIGL